MGWLASGLTPALSTDLTSLFHLSHGNSRCSTKIFIRLARHASWPNCRGLTGTTGVVREESWFRSYRGRRMRISGTVGSEGRGWRSPVSVKPQRSYRRRAAALDSVTHRYSASKSFDMVFPQLAKRAVRPFGGGRQDVADLDIAVGDDHAVDEQL